MKQPNRSQVIEFLEHSNFIESEYSSEALDDAVEAWDYAFDKPFSVNLILDIHKILMKRLRPDIAGRFRKCDVWIDGERKKFIHESKFKEDIKDLISGMVCSTKYWTPMAHAQFPKEEHAKECHIDFEKIHPFEDGNGRVGRIIYNLHRLKLGLPIHVIHEGDEQMDYYKWFQNPISNI